MTINNYSLIKQEEIKENIQKYKCIYKITKEGQHYKFFCLAMHRLQSMKF